MTFDWCSMAKSFALFCLLSFLTTCHRTNQQPDRAQLVDELLLSLFEKGHFNGSVMISDAGQLILGKGYGHHDLLEQQPFTVHTIVDGASVTKTFTAAAIMLLQERGLLSIQDTVKSHLSVVNIPEIQIKHLLSHTSGLPEGGYFFSRMAAHTMVTNGMFLDLVQQLDVPQHQPGEQFIYSNVGYILLAVIIEQVSGQSYFDFLQHNFFQPLGITNASLRPVRLSAWPQHAAVGYKIQLGQKTLNNSADWEAFSGCCNVLFSSHDLHLWSESLEQFQSHVGEGLGGKQSSSQQLRLNAQSWYTHGDGQHFSGDWRGFYTMVYRNEKKQRSIVYVTNNSMPNWLKPQLVFTINQVLDHGTLKQPQKPSSLVVSAKESIVGDYQVANLGKVSVSEGSKGLVIKTTAQPAYKMYALPEGIWYVPAMDYWLHFYGSDSSIQISVAHVSGVFQGRQTENPDVIH